MIDDLVLRAMHVYRIEAEESEGMCVPMQPSKISRVVEHNGRRYVVLVNVRGVLGVYFVSPDNFLLRRLKRWPAEIDK